MSAVEQQASRFVEHRNNQVNQGDWDSYTEDELYFLALSPLVMIIMPMDSSTSLNAYVDRTQCPCHKIYVNAKIKMI
jgi:hypothetical protein